MRVRCSFLPSTITSLGHFTVPCQDISPPQLIRLDPKDGKDSRRFINLSLRGHVGELPQEKQGSWNWNILSFVSTYVDWTESEEEKWEET